MENPRHHRHSFFWPILLVGVGLIWLLVNIGIIAPISVGQILQFWPVLLIMLGIDILFSRRFAWLGSLMAVLALGGLIAFLVMQPHTGTVTYSSGQASQQDTYSAPLDQTSSVTYNLETFSEPVTISALESGSDKLINADLIHQGQIDFSVTGTTNKMVTLSETTNPSNWFSWNFSGINNKWDIALSREIPADVKIDGGSGSINADLSDIQLKSLTADLGSGASSFVLPKSESQLDVAINSGSGSVSMTLPAETSLSMRLQSGSGALSIQLPKDTGVRIEVMDSGSGSLSLPDSLNKISGNNESGTWQSANYDQSENHILIKILDRGSGAISIH
jgi:hypothetical protein